jgi:hypothetical protein
MQRTRAAGCCAAALWSDTRPVSDTEVMRQDHLFPRESVTPERRHARGLAIQLSQGQGRQLLMPEGAPPAVGVQLFKAAVLW